MQSNIQALEEKVQEESTAAETTKVKIDQRYSGKGTVACAVCCVSQSSPLIAPQFRGCIAQPIAEEAE